MQLTLVWEKVVVPGWRPSRDFWLLCGVPLRGETYGRGDEASDVRDTGDWLECWAETGTQSPQVSTAARSELMLEGEL